jgi:hypothetical protein
VNFIGEKFSTLGTVEAATSVPLSQRPLNSSTSHQLDAIGSKVAQIDRKGDD